MKTDIEWIKSAQSALEEHIVKEDKYPKAFKGYISSLAASIVQSGLIPALAIYEADNEGAQNQSRAENNRALLIHALAKILQQKAGLNTGITLLADYAASLPTAEVTGLIRHVNRALIALKPALRFYSADNSSRKELVPTPRMKFQSCQTMPDSSYERPNLGWLFHRDIYRNYKRIENLGEVLLKKRRALLDTVYDRHYQALVAAAIPCSATRLELTTMYPGLLAGSGLSHGVKMDEDIKIGFQFDHTTGLPYIPGSSVKGVLRSCFPEDEQDKSRISYIRQVLSWAKKEDVDASDKQIVALTKQLFAEETSTTKRCIFFDAFITKADKTFIGSDYITPHLKPLSNPIPIQFIKILPKVTFTFAFLFPKAKRMLGTTLFGRQAVSQGIWPNLERRRYRC